MCRVCSDSTCDDGLKYNVSMNSAGFVVCVSVLWSLPLYYRGLIMATRHWLVSRTASLTVSSLYSTRQLGRSLVFVAHCILQMLSPVFTGCGHPNASSLNWRPLSTELFTALHLSTCRTGCSSTSLICRRDVEAGCDRRPPVSSMLSLIHI